MELLHRQSTTAITVHWQCPPPAQNIYVCNLDLVFSTLEICFSMRYINLHLTYSFRLLHKAINRTRPQRIFSDPGNHGPREHFVRTIKNGIIFISLEPFWLTFRTEPKGEGYRKSMITACKVTTHGCIEMRILLLLLLLLLLASSSSSSSSSSPPLLSVLLSRN